jgi:rubredoxin
MKNIDNPLTITCPACGYTFKKKIKPPSLKHGTTIKCPMCGYEFENPNVVPKPDKFDQRKV